MKRPAIWSVITDASGEQYSFARVCAGIALIFIVVWASIVVGFTHSMPELTGAGVFWGIIYGVNRAGESYDKTVQTKAASAAATAATPTQP